MHAALFIVSHRVPFISPSGELHFSTRSASVGRGADRRRVFARYIKTLPALDPEVIRAMRDRGLAGYDTPTPAEYFDVRVTPLMNEGSFYPIPKSMMHVLAP